MAKLPITFKRIKTKDYNNKDALMYLVTVSEKSSFWEKSAIVDRHALLKLKEELEKLLREDTTAEILQVSEDRAAKINTAHKADPLCKDCAHKMTHDCETCLFVLQSPLERKLFLELRKAYISFYPQYPLNRRGEPISVEGKSYDNPTNNFKNVLTIVDFYIEKGNRKICVYTDGHTYHGKEEQARRDRSIDRELQALGFRVMRFTGKDVNEDMRDIISEIQGVLS